MYRSIVQYIHGGQFRLIAHILIRFDVGVYVVVEWMVRDVKMEKIMVLVVVPVDR